MLCDGHTVSLQQVCVQQQEHRSGLCGSPLLVRGPFAEGIQVPWKESTR